MKAQPRNTSVCYGAGSSQNPFLGLGHSHSLVTSTLSKVVAIMLHFLIYPGLGTGT